MIPCLGMEKTKPNTTKAQAHIHQKKCSTTQNYHKKLLGLVVFYDIRPGNGVVYSQRKKISKERASKEK